jgi:hypothetical protein
MKSSPALEAQIAALPKLGRAALSVQYQRLYLKPAPRRWSRVMLEHAVAHHLQRQLNANLRAKMLQALLATEAIVSILSTDSRNTELVREWRGRLHRVVLLGDGVMHEGQSYRSLSAVAQKITGSQREGARFFGAPDSRAKAAAHG